MIVAAWARWSGQAGPQSCAVCSEHPDETADEREERLELRRRWQCDGDGPDVVAEFVCFLCPPPDANGARVLPPRSGCRVCGGTGSWTIKRCPHAYAGEIGREACDAAEMLSSSILPHPGGLDDQPARWLEAALLCGAERAEYENRAREAAARPKG